MPIDPSIPLSGQSVNPLQQMGQMAQTMGGLAQAQAAVQGLRSQQAIGQLIQQDTDPQTGQVDWGRVQADARNNPLTAYGAAKLAETAVAQQTSQQALAGARRKAIVDAVGTLPPDASGEDVANMMATLVSQGVTDRQTAAAALSTAPNDPKQLAGWLKSNFFLPSLGPSGAEAANYGQIVNVPAGGSIIPTRQNPVSGSSQAIAGAEIPVSMGPAEMAARKDVVQGGVKGTVPQSALTDAYGNPKPQGQGAVTGSGGFVQAELTPAEQQASTGSGAALSSFRNDVATSPARVLTLQKALAGLQNSQTGPGTHEINNVKSFLLAQSPEWLRSVIPGLDAKGIEQIKSYDEAQKYLTQVALAQSGSFGPSTNEKLASAITGNASTNISNLAAQDVVKVNIALERMKQAELAAFQKSGLRPDQFQDWAGHWATQVDPRAFEIDLLSPKERKGMLDKMSPQERSTFFQSVRAARAANLPGIVELFPQGAQGGG